MLLDADILIDVWRRHPPAVAWLESNDPPRPSVCGIAGLEFLAGINDKQSMIQAQQMLDGLITSWPDATSANWAMAVYPELKLSHGVGWPDTLIAATALGHDVELATFNLKHFRPFEPFGLKLVQPYER
jgi:predicted nucleic acid-binding protein